jgi:hypothetical protein
MLEKKYKMKRKRLELRRIRRHKETGDTNRGGTCVCTACTYFVETYVRKNQYVLAQRPLRENQYVSPQRPQ